MPEDVVLDAVLVLEAFVCLVPPQVHKHLLAALGLDPATSGSEHSFDQFAIGARTQSILERLFWAR